MQDWAFLLNCLMDGYIKCDQSQYNQALSSFLTMPYQVLVLLDNFKNPVTVTKRPYAIGGGEPCRIEVVAMSKKKCPFKLIFTKAGVYVCER